MAFQAFILSYAYSLKLLIEEAEKCGNDMWKHSINLERRRIILEDDFRPQEEALLIM
jgi:hypothetical protein